MASLTDLRRDPDVLAAIASNVVQLDRDDELYSATVALVCTAMNYLLATDTAHPCTGAQCRFCELLAALKPFTDADEL